MITTQSLTAHALKTDGTLWLVGGRGHYGMNGNNNTTAKTSSPVQIGSLTTWKWVNAGYKHCGAIKTP